MSQVLRGPLTVLGRLLLCTIFLLAAVGNKIPHFSDVARIMESVGVPVPSFMLAGAIVFLIVGSLSVIVGYKAPDRRCPAADVPGPGLVLLPPLLEAGGAGPTRADDPLHEKPVHDGSDAVHRGQRFGADERGFPAAQASNCAR